MQDVFVGQVRGVIFPAVGGGDGFVQGLVRHVQPGGAGVVEVGQGALFEVGLITGLGNRTFGVTGFFFFRGDDPIHPLGWIQPVFTKLVELEGGLGDCLGVCILDIVGSRDVWG